MPSRYLASGAPTEGPRGERIGSFTCHPQEVDQIVTDAWKKVYDGNVPDVHVFVHIFLGKYAAHIDKTSSDTIEVEDLTGEALKDSCINGSFTVGGLDGLTPKMFSILSDRMYAELATLLTLIEKGASWPNALSTAKAAFLSKDDETRRPHGLSCFAHPSCAL